MEESNEVKPPGLFKRMFKGFFRIQFLIIKHTLKFFLPKRAYGLVRKSYHWMRDVACTKNFGLGYLIGGNVSMAQFMFGSKIMPWVTTKILVPCGALLKVVWDEALGFGKVVVEMVS